MGIIFDLDQTLIDSSVAENARNNRQWNLAYNLIPQMRLYDGIGELLETLNDRNIKIAIVTSSPRSYCEKVLKYFKIKTDVIVCYHDTKKHKPDPEPIEAAVRLLNEPVQNIYSLGDDKKDIIASNLAGVNSCLALWGASGSLLLEEAIYIFENVMDFERFILKMEGN